jgi:hypothetical protein
LFSSLHPWKSQENAIICIYLLLSYSLNILASDTIKPELTTTLKHKISFCLKVSKLQYRLKYRYLSTALHPHAHITYQTTGRVNKGDTENPKERRTRELKYVKAMKNTTFIREGGRWRRGKEIYGSEVS